MDKNGSNASFTASGRGHPKVVTAVNQWFTCLYGRVFFRVAQNSAKFHMASGATLKKCEHDEPPRTGFTNHKILAGNQAIESSVKYSLGMKFH